MHAADKGRRARPFLALLASALPALAPVPPAAQTGDALESVEGALCRVIDGAARLHDVPSAFLTRLIWRESSFRAGVTSPAGAQGIAQFMPQTARERSLIDPFDPEQAIPVAASLIADLRSRFGNLGLAAAAYNAGPGRVSSWLGGTGGLPSETRAYVLAVTGRAVEVWASQERGKAPAPEDAGAAGSCEQVAALLRRPGRTSENAEVAGAPIAPWGVQLAGNFSKEQALRSFARARQGYAALLRDAQPMILGRRLRSRGSHLFYQIRLPAPTREAAEGLCRGIRAGGGSCAVLRS